MTGLDEGTYHAVEEPRQLGSRGTCHALHQRKLDHLLTDVSGLLGPDALLLCRAHQWSPRAP
jgi:hypothetical protein